MIFGLLNREILSSELSQPHMSSGGPRVSAIYRSLFLNLHMFLQFSKNIDQNITLVSPSSALDLPISGNPLQPQIVLISGNFKIEDELTVSGV